MMQNIYKKASSVKIYLGEPLDDVDLETGQGLPENEDPKNVSPLYQQLSAVLYSSTREDFFRFPGSHRMRDILRRRWWRCVWVVQEAFLLRHEKVWTYLLPQIVPFHEAHFNVLDRTGPNSAPQCTTEHAMRILNILSRVNEFQASDPRDKIFGLVRVADPQNIVLPRPDYTRSHSGVFSSAARRLILATKSLQILYRLPEFDPFRSPSWMVD
ncbi:uncharacterized protein PAC_17596 [Phialocephala subalpina]|uniref:Uncharacterized protein n=1 Tax=Phialocephala subalpina TaxID=576137 RepID=A0A1L7XRY4_9HELO|nr:uncharacterized protein PAC_17596 [Phialocephala subalpina]